MTIMKLRAVIRRMAAWKVASTASEKVARRLSSRP